MFQKYYYNNLPVCAVNFRVTRVYSLKFGSLSTSYISVSVIFILLLVLIYLITCSVTEDCLIGWLSG
jgi:hypothetical protein